MRDPNPPKLLNELASLLQVDEAGVMSFSEENEEKLRATIEMGARLTPDISIPAMGDVVRLMLALREQNQSQAADCIETCLRESVAASRVLAHIGEAVLPSSSDLRKLGAQVDMKAPSLDDTQKPSGLQVKDFLSGDKRG